MQRRLEADVAAFGEQNRDKIVAVPSETGQGVQHFHPERSLSPEPGRIIGPQRVNSPEEVMAIEGSDGSSSDSELSSLDTIIEDTYSSDLWPSSPPPAPKGPRFTRQGNWHEENAPSSLSAIDSMARLAERRQAQHSQFDVDQVRQRSVEEQQRREGRRHTESKQQVEQARRDRREQILMLRRDYESRVEQFREERAELFDSQDGFEGERYPEEEMIEVQAENNMPEFLRPSSPQGTSAGPSRSARQRRHQAEQIVAPKSSRQQNSTTASSETDRPFVVVAKRVPKLGPCGTMVIDHETGMEMLETRRYRVRADELQSIDEDGDSVMGSDEYYVCNSFTM
jgi:hypothetical protein